MTEEPHTHDEPPVMPRWVPGVIGVVLDEADESAFWMEIATEDGLSRSPRAVVLLDEANQLTAIFAASSITARRRSKIK